MTMYYLTNDNNSASLEVPLLYPQYVNDSFILVGNLGSDTLTSGNANDTVYGGNSAPVVNADGTYANDGNDVLKGGQGNDVLEGGTGSDTYKFSIGDGSDSITDANLFVDATDVIEFSDVASTAVLYSYSGDDLIIKYGTSDQLTVKNYFAPSGRIEQIKYSNGIVLTPAQIYSSLGMVYELENTIKGTGVADVITGVSGKMNVIAGFNGDDTLVGAERRDEVYGGLGNDSLSGLVGNDYLDGGDGNDYLDGGADNDKLFGAAGNDVLAGGAGNDTLIGGDGDDSLVGGTGADVLYAGIGNDTLVADDINDRLYSDDGFVGDVVKVNVDNYFLGQDIIQDPDVTIQYGTGVKPLAAFIQAMLSYSPLQIQGVGQPTTITYSFATAQQSGFFGFVPYTDTVKNQIKTALNHFAETTGITFVETASYDDAQIKLYNQTTYASNAGYWDGSTIRLSTSEADMSVEPGTLGYYTLIHELGHALGLNHFNAFFDTIRNGDVDGIQQTDEASALNYRDANGVAKTWDISLIMPDRTKVFNINDVYSIMAYTKGQEFTNGVRTTVLGTEYGLFDLAALHYAYGVNSSLRAGSNTYSFNDHYIWDGAGTDTFSAASQIIGVNVDLTPGSWIYAGTKLSDGVAANLLVDGQAFIGFGTYIENAVGGSGNDTLTGNALGNNLNGGSGNDSISGGDGSDILKGSLGTDTLDGGVGSDWADYRGTSLAVTVNLATTTAQNTGGWGTDTLVNIENVFGGLGNDSLTGNALGNTIRGGLGNDFMDGLAGGDYVDYRDITTVGLTIDLSLTTAQITGAGTDTILNFESIYSGAANDRLTGNNLANQLLAYAGNDTLSGGLGNDGLQGGVGNDTYLFQRGAGADTLTEADATAGNSDLLWFDTNVTSNQLWFQHTGNNLVVSVIGTSDKVTLSNWYTGSANQVETIKASDGKTLSNAKVDALVSAMSVFAIPAVGTTTLPTSYQTSLNPVLAANWV